MDQLTDQLTNKEIGQKIYDNLCSLNKLHSKILSLYNNFPFEDIDEELDSSHITEDKLIGVVNKIGHFSKDVGKKFQKKYYDDHHLSYFDYDEKEDLVLSLSD